MTHHRSRLCHFVIDCDDLERATTFWMAALDAIEEPISEQSKEIYRKLRLPDSEIRVLLQRTADKKTSKERMHLDLETDDVEAEVQRLEELGATRYDHQQERGFDFWVMRDPFGNEFCVLQPEFPDLLAKRPPWQSSRASLIGERVAAYRRQRDISQRDMAAAVGRSESWVSQVERNVQPVERLSVLQGLARALGVTVRDLRPDLREPSG
jgi:DNA-binding XRE family transcriptional regulator